MAEAAGWAIKELSIHSLIRGWPSSVFLRCFSRVLSIHSLIRGWPSRIACTISVLNLSIHSLIRGWPCSGWTCHCNEASFNSQPHTRLTLISSALALHICPFNSQPHTRLTSFGRTYIESRLLSIHSLRWGWPRLWPECPPVPHLSIHSLRWGWPLITKLALRHIRLSIHSLRWGWPAFRFPDSPQTYSFNSQPQMRLTVTAGRNYLIIISFNSQPQMRLTVGSSSGGIEACFFQFTASD